MTPASLSGSFRARFSVGLAGAAALGLATIGLTAQAGQPPRGSSGPPEHAKVTPVNNLPNPYETVRNFGTLPDGRKWGSVSAVAVDIDGKRVWVGDRCGTNSCAGSDVNPIVKLDPGGKVVPSWAPGRSCGRTAWTSTSRATCGWWTRASATCRGAEEVSRRRRQGPHGR